LLLIAVLASSSPAWAQSSQHEKRLAEILKEPPAPAEELAPNEELLYRWQHASRKFRAIAPQIDEEKLTEALAQLNLLAGQLPNPYRDYASGYRNDLSRLLQQSERDASPRRKGYSYYLQLAKICCGLGDRDATSRLLFRAVAASPLSDGEGTSFGGDVNDFDLTESALLKLDKLLTHPKAKEYLRVSLAQVRVAKKHRVLDQSSLGLILAALDNGHRKLTPETAANDRLRVYEVTIKVFHRELHLAECEAWRSKLLIDFKSDSEVCSRVLLERARDASLRGEEDAAIAIQLRVARDHSGAGFRSQALIYLGRDLQNRRRYRDAIVAYRCVFESRNERTQTESTYHQASHQLAECYEKLGDLGHALEFIELTCTKYHARNECGMGNPINMSNQIKRVQLFTRAGKRAEAIRLLEPLVLRGGDNENHCPTEAAWLLLDLYDKPEQIDAFEDNVQTVMAARRAAWAESLQRKHIKGDVDDYIDSCRKAEMALELVRIIQDPNVADLWTALREYGYSAVDIFSDRHVGRVESVHILSRRAATALVTLPDAGPFLLDNLQGTQREQGWALVLLALMKHPDAPAIFERMAEASLKDQQPNPYTHELRQCLCCAIALHDHANSRWLMTRYGIGTRNKVFGPADLSSLHEVRVMVGLSKPAAE